VSDMRLLAPIVACCGVKLLLFGALFAPAGLLSGNVLLGVGGLAVGVLLVALAVRSRQRCDGSCHAPPRAPARARTATTHQARSSTTSIRNATTRSCDDHDE
jgi:predicted lipid-binding transport protein (Tim44 family)